MIHVAPKLKVMKSESFDAVKINVIRRRLVSFNLSLKISEFSPTYGKLLWKIPEFTGIWEMRFKIKIVEQPTYNAKLFSFQNDAKKSIFGIIILNVESSSENIIEVNLATKNESMATLKLNKRHFKEVVGGSKWIEIRFKMMKIQGLLLQFQAT